MLFRMENRNTAYVTLGAISRMIRSFIVGNVLVGLFMAFVASVVFWIIGFSATAPPGVCNRSCERPIQR